MPDLNGQLSFNVNFDLTGSPKLKLTPSTSIPDLDKPALIGYYAITQPDGITVTGNIGTPEMVWNAGLLVFNTFEVVLRIASDQSYQRGQYSITLFAERAGYTNGQFTQTFTVGYERAIQTFTPDFDCFTPSLTVRDNTDYAKSGYNITTQSNVWVATCPAGTINGTGVLFDMTIGGQYYDCAYSITGTKNIVYTSIANSWLSITDAIIKNFSKSTQIPPSMQLNLAYLISVKERRDAARNCKGDYCKLQKVFEEANALYNLIRGMVCIRATELLLEYFAEYYRITHNLQPLVYTNTNGIIPTYDFVSGCGGTGGGSGAGGTTIIIQCVIGNAYVISGSSETVTGLSSGSTVVSSDDFASVRVEVTRGSLIIPSINPLDGGQFFTKSLPSASITLSSPLSLGEFIIIKTIPQ